MEQTTTPDLSPLESRVLARITEARWQDLTTEMVRTGQPRSGNPLDPDLPSGEEEAIALLIAGKLEAMGMSVEKYEAVPHRPNVVGRLGRAGRRTDADDQRPPGHLSGGRAGEMG